MKSYLTFCTLSIATVFLSVHVQHVDAATTMPKSFEQWCLQKNTLSTETKKTVEVLLKKADTQDCKLAEAKLNRPSSVLYLEYNY
jgi:internalin A